MKGEIVMTTLSECSKIGVTGVLGLEAAAGYWGMCTYDYIGIPIFLFEYEEGPLFLNRYMPFIGIPRKLDNEHIIDISSEYGEGIKVTDKPQTICDMIICDCDLFHMLEAIDDYYTFESEEMIKKLEDLERDYGVYERLQELKIESEGIYDED